MALICSIRLDSHGLDLDLPVYLSLQDVNIRRCFLPATGRVFWHASGSIMAHASRDAKYANCLPLETERVECEFDPATTNALTALYATVKGMPRYATATDA